MKSLKDYVMEREMRRTGGSPENAPFHSKNYRRYFEGYSEYKETDTNKKGKINRVYTGIYHRHLLTDKQHSCLKVSYCLLWFGAVLFFLFAATRYVSSNSVFYVTVPEALSVPGFGWMGWSLFNYITAGRNMTLGEYRYVKSLKNASRFAAAMLTAAAAATIFHIIHVQKEILPELLCAAVLLLAGIMCLVVFIIETHVSYETFTSDQAASSHADQISF